MTAAAASRLPRYLATAYTLLAVYGSLHPLTGWIDTGVSPFAFLATAWPRYFTGLDVAVNILAYVPLGFLWLLALRPACGRWLAPVLALLIGAVLSLAMESLQNFLPSRVPSSLDLACNLVGTVLGIGVARMGDDQWFAPARLHQLRARLIAEGVWADWGLLLLLLWLLTQLNPETLLFGNGDLRRLAGLPTALTYSAQTFPQVESLVVGTNTLAIGLALSLLVRHRYLILLPLLMALLAKSLVFILAKGPGSGLAWATEGSLMGLVAGGVLLLAGLSLPTVGRRILAATLLLLATVLVNLAPENPYLANTFQVWNPGQFLNFHGLTRLASDFWPFLALPWLMMPIGER